MHQTFKLSILFLGTSLFFGCSGKNITLQSYADTLFNDKVQTQKQENRAEEPKKNPAADIAWSSVSKADVNNRGEGSMQKSLDTWTKEEWEPAFKDDKDQAEKDKAANKHFTLQHYFDKSQKYLEKKEKKNKDKPKEPAHYEKIKSLPVIGE